MQVINDAPATNYLEFFSEIPRQLQQDRIAFDANVATIEESIESRVKSVTARENECTSREALLNDRGVSLQNEKTAFDTRVKVFQDKVSNLTG